MARQGTWALVTNGVRARILRGLEDGDSEDPVELVSKTASTHLREILSDKPGRSFESDGSGRRAGRLTRLAIFAAPKILGILRQELPTSLKEAVILQRDVNLIPLPEKELRDTMIATLRKERES